MIPAFDTAACLATSWHATADVWLRAGVAAALVVVAGRIVALRFFPGQRVFVALVATMTAWLVVATVERAAGTPACKATLAMAAWPAIALVPMLWALFLFRHRRSDHRPLPKAQVAAVVAVAAGAFAVATSNGLHGLLYGAGTRAGAAVAGVVQVHYAHGPAFWALAAWCYGWLIAGAAMVVGAIRDASGAERRQWQGLLAMSLVPWVANAAYVATDWQVAGGDPTPLGFAAAAGGMAWLLRRQALFRIVPMARRLLFTELPDAVVVVDAEGRVMEANAAATALAGGVAPPRATPLAQWPRFGAAVAARLAGGAPTSLVTLDRPLAIHELRVRPIGDPPRRIGHLLQLRDVTEQQRAQERIVQTLAERNAQLGRVAALQHELRAQALRDPLTGLFNRRALVQRYAEEVAHRQATGGALSLAVVDVDHFKRINDGHGHAAGDRVLCAIGRAMLETLRASDSVFRIGGEEFALLLPGASASQAALRVDELRHRVATADYGVDGVRVTISAGVAAIGDGDGASLDALLHAADGALYRAKAAGRDRVVATGVDP